MRDLLLPSILAVVLKLTMFFVDNAYAQMPGSPYLESGIAKCSAPGTSIDFQLDGTGSARVLKSASNYDGFRSAARIKVWRVSRVEKDGKHLIVFDNGKNSRIMTLAGSQKSMGFIADGGVSDMLCQILVQAR
jgi:hypothetical protein